MSTDSEAETLRTEIAELRAHIEQTRNELYALSTAYAAGHFKVQATMHALGVERLRHASVKSEAAMLEQRCLALEESIAALRAILAGAGVNPDA